MSQSPTPEVVSGTTDLPTTGGAMDSDRIIESIRKFSAEREWGQFHSHANLAKSICIEAAELLECFQWSDEAVPERIEEELADVLTYCFLLADSIGSDPNQLILSKLERTREKYPVVKSRGRYTKYDQL